MSLLTDLDSIRNLQSIKNTPGKLRREKNYGTHNFLYNKIYKKTEENKDVEIFINGFRLKPKYFRKGAIETCLLGIGTFKRVFLFTLFFEDGRSTDVALTSDNSWKWVTEKHKNPLQELFTFEELVENQKKAHVINLAPKVYTYTSDEDFGNIIIMDLVRGTEICNVGSQVTIQLKLLEDYLKLGKLNLLNMDANCENIFLENDKLTIIDDICTLSTISDNLDFLFSIIFIPYKNLTFDYNKNLKVILCIISVMNFDELRTFAQDWLDTNGTENKVVNITSDKYKDFYEKANNLIQNFLTKNAGKRTYKNKQRLQKSRRLYFKVNV